MKCTHGKSLCVPCDPEGFADALCGAFERRQEWEQEQEAKRIAEERAADLMGVTCAMAICLGLPGAILLLGWLL